MKIFRFFILTLLSISLFAVGAAAQGKKKKAVKKTRATAAKKTTNQNVNQPVVEARKEDYKIIAQGTNANSEEPFLFVARDAKTFALLRAVVENLPDASSVDFTKEAVVAAFAGTKSAAGWEVLIRRLSDRVLIDLNEPRKDMMHAQMLTTPYKIAVVPVEEEKPLPVDATPTWTNKMKTYRVAKASFSYSGGFAYREKNLDAEGTVNVMTNGDLITLAFNLGAKGDKKITLAETASGSLKDGKIELARLDAGGFSENPKPPVNVSGTISDTKISLKFEPNPTTVADGFEARGTVEAVKVK